MTKEDKQLLLKDLCARLPYGVKIDEGYEEDLEDPPTLLTINHLYVNDNYPIETIKPYLRPISSMTEEEEDELIGLQIDPLLKRTENHHTRKDDLILRCQSSYLPTDWLNAHYFDYRSLIEKGIALEAPEGMYNTKN